MSKPDIDFIAELECIVKERLAQGSNESYTARLASAGTKRIAQKVGEEGVELALAATAGSQQETIDEAADLVYHLIVLLAHNNLSLAEISARLKARHAA